MLLLGIFAQTVEYCYFGQTNYDTRTTPLTNKPMYAFER